MAGKFAALCGQRVWSASAAGAAAGAFRSLCGTGATHVFKLVVPRAQA